VSPRASGAIPGLLRRGSPVIKAWGMADDSDRFTAQGVVIRREPDDIAGERWRCWFDDSRIGMDVGFAPALDLTDPTGMDHGARWLAEQVGLVVGATAPSWYSDGEDAWVLRTPPESRAQGRTRMTFHGFDVLDKLPGEMLVPSISALTSPAEALALAIAHVAGSGS
jgi:hypothetical protein